VGDAQPTTRLSSEVFPPPPLRAPRGARGWLSYSARLLLDARVGAIWRLARRELPHWSGRVLDVGCGDGPWRWLLSPEALYVGLDVPIASSGFGYRPGKGCQVIYDGRRFPFVDKAFDHVLCTEVLEHVSEPGRFLRECQRITLPLGTCFFSVPFAARYHYVPHDYWRFTPAALTKLFTDAGWGNVCVVPLGTDVSVAAYKVNALFLKLVMGSRSGTRHPILFLVALLVAPVFAMMKAIEVISTMARIGSDLDPLGYVVLAVRQGAEGRGE
jgi:SAM-dependent methyltransferase